MKNGGKKAKLSDVMMFSHGRGCLGHKLTPEEMGIIKHTDAVRNSQIRRGVIADDRNTRHVQCGCGAPGCVFVQSQTQTD